MGMNRQEFFNKAYLGLASQGFVRSTTGGAFAPGCQYRLETQDGVLKCAIGHCIPDELYTPEMEATTLRMVLEAMGIRGDDDYVFARDLQSAHDTARSPKSMEYSLQRIARKHNLTVPELP